MHNEESGDFPGASVTRLHAPKVGGLGSIPGQGTRSHMLQLRVYMLQLKIPHATKKTEDHTCCN